MAQDPLDAIGREVVVPVVREDDATAALATVQRLRAAGAGVIELTATIPAWETALEAVRGEHPELVLGAGTLRDAGQAEAAIAAGADFLVSPHPAPTVRALAVAAGVPLLEGGFTPGEVLAAADHGVAKLFPAHVGGPALLRSILALAPGARIMPTGGIALDEAEDWLAAGAFAVGVGSELHDRPDAAERVTELRERRRS